MPHGKDKVDEGGEEEQKRQPRRSIRSRVLVMRISNEKLDEKEHGEIRLEDGTATNTRWLTCR